MFEAARVGDEIQHTSALAGFLIGAILGAALIFAVAMLTISCPFLVGFIAGFMASMIAEQIVNIATQLGSLFTSTTGSITEGSANVYVNGRAAVPAKISAAACDHDTPHELAACGSSTVFINQHVAARKGDDIQCGATIEKGSKNVFFGSDKACEIAVASEIPAWAVNLKNALFLVAGVAGGLAGALKNGMKVTCPCVLKFLAGQVAGIYVGSKVSEGVSGLFGHPVHVPTGQKVLVNELDFELPGLLPFFGSRSYSSAIDTCGMLGRGWQHNWDIHLKRSSRGLEYVGFQGREVGFDDIPAGQYQYNSFEQLYLSHALDGRYVLNGLDEIFYGFSVRPMNDRHVLERIEDKFGHFIEFRRDSGGALIEVRNDADVVLELHHADGRLIGVDRVDGTRRSLIRYGYDENGQLIRVRDRTDTLVRQFAYAAGLMIRHANALGFTCSYRYAQYGDEWRVVEHATDSGERYTFAYDIETRRASVSSEALGTQHWEYDADSLVTQWTDYLGARYQFEYDGHQQLVRIESPGERIQRLDYDALGRIAKTVDATGRVWQSTYHLKTLRLSSNTLPDGSVWQWNHTEQGLPVERIDPLGQVARFEHDGRGLLTCYTDERGGTNRLTYDDRYGLLLSRTDCSGSTTRYAWNDESELVRQTDALGQVTQLLRNATGAVGTVVHADGTRETFEYNALGQISRHSNALGYVSRWDYTPRGQAERYTDRLGRTLTYRYNANGQLVRLTNANGASYDFSYDAAGRLTAEVRLNGVRRELRYNPNGEVIAQTMTGRHGESEMIGLERDAAGRLIGKHGRCATTRYVHDPLDRVTAVHRQPCAAGVALGIEPCEVTFEYDALGRLLAETVDGQRSESRHDALGNLTERRLPLGQRISMLHYGSGHVHQISLDGETLSDIERDALHREVQRTQGPRVCRTTYDPRGRTVSRLSERSGREGMADNDLLGSAYQYDLAGNLHQVIGQGGGAHSRGTVHYSYDVMGRMTGYHDGNGLNESYLYDAADNLIDATRDSAASRILDDLLSRFRQTGYSYDGFGQLKRRVRDGLVQDFVHDDEGRMVRASGQGRHGWHSTAYHYDAIGRRTGKVTRRAAADGTALVEETRFVWEGMRMVQVLRDETVRTYVYSPDSPYRPMARVDQPVVSVDGQCRAGDRRVVWHHHAHDNGQVYDVTGANGEVVWEPGFTGFGEYRGTEWLDDRPFDEALRFAGQYADEETGLHYNTFRYYDPATGRFVSQDPIGLAGGFNLYAYAPNPVSWIDPWGLSCETIDPRTESFESWVARSRGEADVYLRSKGTGSVDYVGISKNSTERYAAGLGYKLRLLTEDTGQLLRNQARAVEQAIIDAKRGVFENIDNSIDPGRALYKDAVSWGQNWLKDNGWGRLLE
ncbi:RHS repeat-associated protein [Paraburkholderia sp. BL6669N2]|uniref:RHS repeat-associated core domain-containing protein n=1 Tax=Paraburkholderia sp. BL6669N2 TaxID=1938807 RepID=UPI000E22BF1F|nr:RHS repeat-associated core domain-containing protein [Paraburkholderia sp. BL6669N2]REG61337.1 RHS repeat-associated protein [Paraburkholderia sp. BL6669N2]